MTCSPSSLFLDVTLWFIPGISDFVLQSYRNLSKGDTYDCFLTSVPCESNLTKLLIPYALSQFFWFDTIFVYTILTLVVSFGIFGNVVNIAIFSTHDIVSDSTNSLLIALSCSDLMSLLLIGVMLCCNFLCFVDESLAPNATNHILSNLLPMTRWFNVLSLDFVTAIAVQRAAAVVVPFKVSTMFTHRKVKTFIIIMTMICFCSMCPLWISNYPRWVFHPYFDKKITLGYKYRIKYSSIVRFITLYYNIRSGIDLVVIFIRWSITIFMLIKQAKRRSMLTNTSCSNEKGAPKKNVRETKVIKMSLGVCVITFLVCSVGMSVNGVIQIYSEELFKTPFWAVGEYILLFLNTVNSSFNFVMYLGMSDKYKTILKNGFSYTNFVKRK